MTKSQSSLSFHMPSVRSFSEYAWEESRNLLLVECYVLFLSVFKLFMLHFLKPCNLLFIKFAYGARGYVCAGHGMSVEVRVNVLPPWRFRDQTW